MAGLQPEKGCAEYVLGDTVMVGQGIDPTMLAFYDSYYKVLSEYLEEINYGGTQAASGTGLARQAPTPVALAPALQTVASPPALIGSNGASVTPTRSRKDRLAELKELLEEGLVTQDEFDARRREILAEV